MFTEYVQFSSASISYRPRGPNVICRHIRKGLLGNWKKAVEVIFKCIDKYGQNSFESLTYYLFVMIVKRHIVTRLKLKFY